MNFYSQLGHHFYRHAGFSLIHFQPNYLLLKLICALWLNVVLPLCISDKYLDPGGTCSPVFSHDTLVWTLQPEEYYDLSADGV